MSATSVPARGAAASDFDTDRARRAEAARLELMSRSNEGTRRNFEGSESSDAVDALSTESSNAVDTLPTD
jgi:hypothetical protein